MEGDDEVAGVATSFNAAADRIEALLAAHRGLLAHASHELRSPLTRLRLAVEMFSRDPGAESCRRHRRDIAELDGLVEEILLASRLDHGPAEAAPEAVDFLALAAEEAARAGAAVRVEGADKLFESSPDRPACCGGWCATSWRTPCGMARRLWRSSSPRRTARRPA